MSDRSRKILKPAAAVGVLATMASVWWFALKPRGKVKLDEPDQKRGKDKKAPTGWKSLEVSPDILGELFKRVDGMEQATAANTEEDEHGPNG